MNMIPLHQPDPAPVRQIYLIVTQTGSVLSRILKVVTGAEYNHVSISLSPSLTRMYSFGRKHPYNPFWAGFVVESPHTGTFKRFSNTKAAVVALPVSRESYDRIVHTIRGMLTEQPLYHYNILGLALAGLHIRYRKEKCYYCSEFVKEILLHSQVEGAEQLTPIVQPIQFLEISNGVQIYCGYLRDYPAAAP